LLTRQQGKWVGYSYCWNDEQTDAELVAAAGVDRVFEIRDAAAPGGVRKQTWHYPSRTECMVCHSRAANFVLGLTELQMNKDHDYGGAVDNQLRTLEHLGVFRVNVGVHVRETKQTLQRWREQAEHWAGMPFESMLRLAPQPPRAAQTVFNQVRAPLTAPWRGLQRTMDKPLKELEESETPTRLLPKSLSEYRRLVNPYDRRESLDARARSYLHANCAQCHVEAGGGNAQMELEFTMARNKMRLIDVKPLHHNYGVADAKLVAPGFPDRSMLLKRIATRGQGQMPPLASSELDHEAIALIKEWIAGMKSYKDK
jgi:hypothetical protein